MEVNAKVGSFEDGIENSPFLASTQLSLNENSKRGIDLFLPLYHIRCLPFWGVNGKKPK
jgi:hypothetical protein